jgi:hypothetical protein
MNTIIHYKAVRADNHRSWFDNKTEWITGNTIICENPKMGNKPCGIGLHSSPTLLNAVAYQQGPSEYLQVILSGKQILGKDKSKTRSSQLICGQFLTPEETDREVGFKLWEANHPVHPLLVNKKDIPQEELLTLLKKWDSVRDSVGSSVGYSVRDSVRDSVWASVWDSVRDSVWASVWDSMWASVSVWDSVWDSVGAYIGGLFPSITEWKYAEKLGPDPWRPLLTLWYAGYVPSNDGTIWRLHAAEKAEIILTWDKSKESGKCL